MSFNIESSNISSSNGDEGNNGTSPILTSASPSILLPSINNNSSSTPPPSSNIPTTFDFTNGFNSSNASNSSTSSLLSGLDSFQSSSPNGKLNPNNNSNLLGSNSTGKEDFRRRRSQSKSMSYSNFNNLLPVDQLTEADINNEEILDICSMLKERLKQLSIQLELDLSEIDHKSQEIELLQSRINQYNKDIRDKEEENERLQEKIIIATSDTQDKSQRIEEYEEELQTIKKTWVQPQEIEVWKEQISVLTSETEKKDKYLSEWAEKCDLAEKKVESLQEQFRKERDVALILRQDSETTHKQFIHEREQYFKEIENSNNRLIKYKSKNYDLNQQLKRMESDYDNSMKQQEKLKTQLSTSEKENIELKHAVEKLQHQLIDSHRSYADLSNSQQSMTQELKHSESERLAMIGLMNKSELEIDERLLLLMQECSKSNDTINKLTSQIKDMERQLTDERLTRQISNISLTNATFSLTERDLIRMVQEKDDEIQRQLKQIQRLHVDNNTLRIKSKKLEDHINDNSNQLLQTKKSLRSSRKELSKITQELLYISNENFNDSFGSTSTTTNNNNNNNNNSSFSTDDSISAFNKRKSLDSSLLQHIHDISQNNYTDSDEDDGASNGDLNNISPIKPGGIINGNTPISNRNRSLTSYSSVTGISPTRNSLLSPVKANISTTNLNQSTSSMPSTIRSVEQLEDMLEKARSANMGYILHIQFLSKEIKSMELEIKQQRDYTNNIVSRLNMDLEESKRLNSRIRKTFLSRFTKEDDLIFLDYYTMTDKFHKPNYLLDSPILSNSSSTSLSSSYGSSSSFSPQIPSPTLTSSSSSNILSNEKLNNINTIPTVNQSPLNKITVITDQQTKSSPTTNNTSSGSSINSSGNQIINNSNSSSNINNKLSNKTTKKPSVDISKHCGRCSKEFTLFVRKYQCIHCTMNYCADCYSAKTKTCVFCTMSSK